MRALLRKKSTPLYVPDYMATSIEDIDFSLLVSKGIKYIAFDADSTLVPYRGIEIAPSTKKYLLNQQHLFDGWCIASNRVTNDLHPLASDLKAGVVRAGFVIRKPKKAFFKRVAHYFDAPPQEIAMIGDKLIADIWGGNRARFTTVWVEHLGRDSTIDRITHIRQIEKKLLKKYLKS